MNESDFLDNYSEIVLEEYNARLERAASWHNARMEQEFDSISDTVKRRDLDGDADRVLNACPPPSAMPYKDYVEFVTEEAKKHDLSCTDLFIRSRASLIWHGCCNHIDAPRGALELWQEYKARNHYDYDERRNSVETKAQTEEKKKSTEEVSRAIRTDFANALAQRMAGVAERISKGETLPSFDMPYSAVSGREYSGANQTQLVLAGLEKGYLDNRWIGFEQLNVIRDAHPLLTLEIPRGEKGVTLLRSHEASYIDRKGEREWLSNARKAEIAQMRANGEDAPEIKKTVLFSKYTVFNAEQIPGFPVKENPKPALSAEERDAVIDGVIAAAGIRVGEDDLSRQNHISTYGPIRDTIYMPPKDTFASHDECQATKLRKFFHATGHKSREGRFNDQGEFAINMGKSTLRDVAYEEMRGEFFSMFAAAKYGLPMPADTSAEHLSRWDRTFGSMSGNYAVLAAADASKMFAVINQFERGEQPAAKWFPPKEEWSLKGGQEAQTADPVSEEQFQPASLTAGNPVERAMIILRDQALLDRALQQDPACATELAQLCDSLAGVLHMESQAQALMAQQLQDTAPPPPVPLQQAQSAGMRM
jgi:antirestriction protein ArdC